MSKYMKIGSYEFNLGQPAETSRLMSMPKSYLVEADRKNTRIIEGEPIQNSTIYGFLEI